MALKVETEMTDAIY